MFAGLLREAVPEPFRIGPVLIPHPTDEAVCALDGAATPRQILEALCGQEFESVWNRVRHGQ